MAVFEARYVTVHVYSFHRTRARGWRAGKGGWAVVPQCSCGWNHTHTAKYGWRKSPRGSIFSDHYPTVEEAEKVWETEHMGDMGELPPDDGQLLLVLVR